MAITATTFVAGVSALIRVGRTLRAEYVQHLLDRDFEALLPPGFPPARNSLAMQVAACDHIRLRHPELVRPGGTFVGMFRDPDGPRPVLADGAETMLEAAIEFYLSSVGGEAAARSYDLDGKPLAISRAAVLTHKEWVDPARRPRWGRLGVQIADIALDVISVQPDVLGLNRRATEIVGALAAHMNVLVENDEVGEGSDDSPGERLVRSFVQASLETVAERPELFVSSERWKPLVAGLVVPLKEHVAANPGLEFASRERLRGLLRGPIAHSVLTVLNANADTFLTSRFGSDEALGAVTRSVLGAITSADQAGFDLREVFSGEGAVMVYEAALDIAKDRPDLFIQGLGAGEDSSRQFLRRIASVLDDAPRPYQWRSGLAPQIAAMSLEVAGVYASQKLRAGDSPWAQVSGDVADTLIGSIIAGFNTAATGAANPFERLFDREQALDILRIIAVRAAETPSMLVGANAGAEVLNIAKGVAAMLSEDADGLLDGEDWRTIVATAMNVAAKNPGALFGIDATSDPKAQVGVALVSKLLERASANMAEGRRPGAILFGDTLRQAIVATVEAAASKLIAPGGVIANFDATTGAGSLPVASLDAFIAHLLSLAGGEDPVFRMSADEWLYVYQELVAHVIAEGPAAFPIPGSDDPGTSPSRITDQVILDLLQGVATKVLEDGDVG